jgi:hypothetical protein
MTLKALHVRRVRGRIKGLLRMPRAQDTLLARKPKLKIVGAQMKAHRLFLRVIRK